MLRDPSRPFCRGWFPVCCTRIPGTADISWSSF
jgi:hypothetical protein